MNIWKSIRVYFVIKSKRRFRWNEKQLCLGPTKHLIELLPIVFPANSNLSWRVTPRRTLVPKGMDPIIDFGTCYTSTEAVFEPPSSFVMISAPGFFTSGVSRSLRAVISVICENQVEMCCSLGWKTHIASSVHICVFGTSAQTIRKGGAILAEPSTRVSAHIGTIAPPNLSWNPGGGPTCYIR